MDTVITIVTGIRFTRDIAAGSKYGKVWKFYVSLVTHMADSA